MRMVFAMFILSAAVSLGAPKPTPTPDQIPSRNALLQTIDHIQRIAREQQDNLELEKKEHLKADKALEMVSSSLADATTANLKLQVDIKKQTDKLNETQDKLDKTAKALWWYRLHWWGAWVMLGLGVLACAVFAFLKFTGRLAIVGAAVASKIP